VTPTLTYYDGSGTAGTSLGATPPTAAGTYTVVASFAGTANYSAVQSEPVTFTIRLATATVAFASSAGSTVYGQPITFIARVAAAGNPSGTVTFLDGDTALATVSLDSSGAAILTASDVATGFHSITASYSGDAGTGGAQSGSATESVARSSTTIVLVPHPVLKKKKVKSEVLTAEIKPPYPGGGLPTGMVTFELLTKKRKKIHTKIIATAAVSGGDATLTFKPKRVLRKVITIFYSGDPDYKASTLTAPKLRKNGLL
jgi:large repetitive protein